VIIQKNLPLERRLEELASEPSNDFPDRSASYWIRYVAIKEWIANQYYQSAAAGLAQTRDRFTKHDISHVDDVIATAGLLLGHKADASETMLDRMAPYEIYVLLIAILLHDAGNAEGRELHETRPKAIIAELANAHSFKPIERKLIASIAEAHGGRTKDGDKDTISRIVLEDVMDLNDIEIRGRMLAAVLRLADELSENDRRADPQALRKPYDPPWSAIHNLYCSIINRRIEYNSGAIYLRYTVTKEQLLEKFVLHKDDEKTVLLVDYIATRIEKCDCERRYCNRFLKNMSYDRIYVELKIVDENYDPIDEIKIKLEDEGYPGMVKSIKEQNPDFDGSSLRNKHYSESSAA